MQSVPCDTEHMPKRLSTRDANQSAFDLVQRIIAKTEDPPPEKESARIVSIVGRKRKNPAAVALGRIGGRKSAAARMQKIAPADRHRRLWARAWFLLSF